MNKRWTFIGTIVMAAAGLITAGDWPAFRGSMERTGYVDEVIAPPQGKAAWCASLGCEVVSSPAVAGGVLYIGGRDSCVHALDIATGKALWKYRTGGWIDASPLVSGGLVYAGSRDGYVYILEKNTGALRGTLAAGVQLSSPAVRSDGSIVTATAAEDGGGLLGFSAGAAGAAKWRVEFPQVSYSSAAIAGSMAVVGHSGGVWQGIDLDKKNIVWSIATGGDVFLSTAAINGGTAFFAAGNGDRSVYAADLATGAVRWKSAPAAPALAKITARGLRPLSSMELTRLRGLSPAQRGGAVTQLRLRGVHVPAILDNRGLLRTRAELSPADFCPFGDMRTSSVAMSGGAVYLVQKELGYPDPQYSLVALDRNDGSEKWRFTDMQAGSVLGYCASPLATRSLVFAGWGGGRIYAFDAASGEKRWADTLQGEIISSPALAQGKLFVATMDGYVYGYRLASPAAAGMPLPPAITGSMRGDARLRFGIATAGRVKVRIYSLDGQLVGTVVDRVMEAGSHAVALGGTARSGARTGAGPYLVRLETPAGTTVMRMLTAK